MKPRIRNNEHVRVIRERKVFGITVMKDTLTIAGSNPVITQHALNLSANVYEPDNQQNLLDWNQQNQTALIGY